ncbi:hypothetical protein FVEG_03294 [Fusarium verticillioides 7600]|uniref:Uncharacterized protein n=1 Tax=Gibberella moniliformis (strain M3125 / FGSC 7600) TaxID=334819 RepID=W7LRG0_GIBM7|nr:hypothetical protein FVEG_03294 [Fusarium verticillioides 7600]EWG41131.1 hypothetical protein FVEG_03294 [Fusarium verticillioides 7600]
MGSSRAIIELSFVRPNLTRVSTPRKKSLSRHHINDRQGEAYYWCRSKGLLVVVRGSDDDTLKEYVTIINVTVIQLVQVCLQPRSADRYTVMVRKNGYE